MAVTYEDALATLEAMFGSQGWTKDQLGELLRVQQGHMERTCEIILQNDGVPAAQVLKNQNQDTSNDEALARRLAQGEPRRPVAAPQTPVPAPAPPNPPPQKKGKGTPTTLPRDFLRIPDYSGVGGENHADASSSVPSPATQPQMSSQMSEDEQLARMLQNELFLTELQNNPEFSYLAQQQGFAGQGQGPQRNISGNVSRSQGGGASGGSGGGNKNFGESLANMTDEAKRRFSLFAKNFNKKSKKKQPADHEQQGLLDAEEEITFSPFANDSRSSDSGVELGSFVSSPNKRKDD
ncbi:hypothetical protein TrVE_jg12385 [Triparma verrucosa]|uniref:CUE domain-containing protein n=1 Tax=Triparma verrucosa TaxID=1606542 RepID=A0A9W7FBF4_9STRA|nr:hypothetical protein TrVE_jg12385 [Triparma verrucosa]|mmetsp:Transcript_21897/g.41210  ORF Transcript_21897/g.41210 Transcript_21897/m.41210 type:complete len:294 (-) Transcript_21897:40-921(-)|eukprot:CAMPEP_0182496872 /NCGR_PEP_ID=MMETSP1321-20130603/5452_1 /TAXON_ID=91990 /ORGANISM="Bolidomonas sp., Strain RCC1657" /LENGTH=293 /DNA_ID=CAMNT_0024700599 /DNA_START=112 /DNA_END=993 /DNA_ORIENTATION=+